MLQLVDATQRWGLLMQLHPSNPHTPYLRLATPCEPGSYASEAKRWRAIGPSFTADLDIEVAPVLVVEHDAPFAENDCRCKCTKVTPMAPYLRLDTPYEPGPGRDS